MRRTKCGMCIDMRLQGAAILIFSLWSRALCQFKHRCAVGDNGAKSGTDCADALRDSSNAFESAYNVFSNNFKLAERADRSERVLSRSRVPKCHAICHDDVGCKDGRQIGIQTI